jgi:hypothetical protein
MVFTVMNTRETNMTIMTAKTRRMFFMAGIVEA